MKILHPRRQIVGKLALEKLPGLAAWTCATVLKDVVGGAAGGSSAKNFAAREFGNWEATKLTNCGVSSRTTEVEADDRLKW